jgi:hypothetical protein
MAFIVLPGFILDRTYFHSAGLKMVQPKPAEGAEALPPFLALQVNEFHGQELFTNVIRGGSDQETNNDFIELLTQLAAIDKQNPPIAGSQIGAPRVQGGPASES